MKRGRSLSWRITSDAIDIDPYSLDILRSIGIDYSGAASAGGSIMAAFALCASIFKPGCDELYVTSEQ